MNKTIEILLQESHRFPPNRSFQERAYVKDNSLFELANDFETFWNEQSKFLDWIEPFHTICDRSNPPFYSWFVGGKLNASFNCLDRHIFSGHGNKAAIIWEGEPGDRRTLTYRELWRSVNKFANALKKLGVSKGDRVAIYLPLIPEAVISMLACARIGAIHSVVFGGFSPESLRDRINDAQAKVLITADGGWRRGEVLPLKHDADVAISQCPSIKHVVIVKRGDFLLRVKEGRDHWYHRLMQEAPAHCDPEAMFSNDPLFTLYTSGSTGKPKGILHHTGGYLVWVNRTTQWVFDIRPEDVFWCTADVGWITGHSYLVYGPLSLGATIVMYEGAPDYPEKDRFWEIIERHGVTIFYTAPTAIRAFMKWGNEHPEKHDLSTLRLLGTVGEPINPAAWLWYHQTIGRGKCPIVDTWWQTETGGILISPLPGLTTTVPGSATKPLPGIDAAVLDEQGNEVPINQGGYLAIRKPWPGMLAGIWGDEERYKQVYWSKWENVYFPGDGARIDEDGNFWLLGRVDDVMNVAGHRISTMEVESALVSHPDVSEAAVVGIEHDIKGEAIAAFVTLKGGKLGDVEMVSKLKEHVANTIGAIAKPEKILFSVDLPKTRSGKIMRRLLRDIALGRVLGDTTTLADPSVVEFLKKKYEEQES
ncbi:MAG: acetate--CoA ligase [bacterium]|nr:acetate--CoA ligase [bacterium]